MTTTTTTAPATLIDTLSAKLADPATRDAILDNETLAAKLHANPATAPLIEAAVLARDAEQQQAAPAGSDDDLLAALETPAPAATKTKRKAKAKPAPDKPAAPTEFVYRVTRHKSGTAGNIARGKAKRPSVHTIAVERVTPDGSVYDRLMLGSTQAAMIGNLSPEEIAKLLPATKTKAKTE